MCTILAHDANGHGCIAWQTKPGLELRQLKIDLESIVEGKHIQIVTVSRPTAYYEYAPYRFAKTKEELMDEVKKMIAKKGN